VFAEDKITSPPAWEDGAEGWETTPSGSYNDIRDAFPQPLDFNDFWDELDTLKSAACSGGMYLDDADGWRIHPFVTGGVGKLEVCKNTNNHNETWWWTNGNDAEWNSASCWTEDVPANGMVGAKPARGDRRSEFLGG
jgi:hypothetical protein